MRHRVPPKYLSKINRIPKIFELSIITWNSESNSNSLMTYRAVTPAAALTILQILFWM